MHDTEQLPLDIHLHPAAQTKALQANAAGEMTKHRLDDPQSSAVLLPALGGIDLLFHLRRVVLLN